MTTMIEKLYSKYQDNPYMIQRLELHLTNLPGLLEQEHKRYDERVSRFNELTLEQETFFKVFLSKHQYYYMPHNNLYYEYDGKTYKIIKDDDIHHTLLSTITDEGKLIQWKHKTKQTIVKKIKERTLFKSTPETYTIQNVLNFLQTIFSTKIESKYFLTVIGDCILKKNGDELYFVSSNMKKVVTLIDSIGYITTGTSIMNNFITKFHDSHKINTYRLINTSEIDNAFSYDIIKEILNQIGIDMLCVATHYSDRYTSAENYLHLCTFKPSPTPSPIQVEKNDKSVTERTFEISNDVKMKIDESVRNNIMYFVENPLEKIVDEFISQCIETVASESSISWKNVHYIWKLYLTNLSIPNMIYSTQLQSLLAEKIENTNENGNIVFLNVTSKYLPYVSSFLSFWDKYIVITNDNFDDEYEIDELITLYKNSNQKISQISDTNMIKMVRHYFSPQVEIIDNKYVTNIKCNLWSKHDDINEYLYYFKNITSKADEKAQQLISFEELYQGYRNYFKAKSVTEQKTFPIVSKHFFEKFISNQLTTYIQFDKFVSSDWLFC